MNFFQNFFLKKTLLTVNENIDDAILIFNSRLKCKYKNSNAKKLILHKEKFSEKKALSLLKKARNTKDYESTKITHGEFFVQNGEERQFALFSKDFFLNKKFVASCLKLSDKTEQSRRFLTQKFLATHDELTGCYKREHFFSLCDKMIKKVANKYVMISTNIAQFKLLNEIFGEEVGDKVLVAIATSLKTIMIHESVTGRINDDKFCCLVKKDFFSENSLEDISHAAQEVLKNSMYKINLRIGLCEIHSANENAQFLYDKTQLAIKQNRNNTRKNYAWYDSDLMDALLREKQIASDFDAALLQGNIQMYLQPIFDSEKKVFGVEALARWKHETCGTMLPETFIPVLERAGLVHKLDRFIWKSAAETLSRWQKKNFLTTPISVNVSPKDFLYMDIPKEFEQLLSEFDFCAKNLKIEFTEETIVHNKKGASEIFSKLKKLGFEIIIDDFGSGNSSLNMIKNINADILKMNMSLIQHDKNPHRAKIILNFIVELSHALEMKLVSEGVENSLQFEKLKKLGCDYFQGFYFSQPISQKEFEKKYF